MQKIKVWDLPIRICHWSLVLIITFQYLSAEILSDDILPNPLKWHFIAGYTCIGIIVFRICWGFLGTHYAKFVNFIKAPSALVSYFSKKGLPDESTYIGHNPAGAYSIIVLLSLLISQAISGLFISDEIFNDGPYYGILSETWQSLMNFLHHNVYIALYAFIAFHVGAIIVYKVKFKQALTKAMITGEKLIDDSEHKKSISVDTPQESFPWLGFLISVAISLATVYVIVEVLPPPPSDDFYM